MNAARATLAVLVALLLWSAPAHAETFVVTTTEDFGLGGCTEGGDCSLRGAIQAANERDGADVVTVPASAQPYKLTIAGTNEDADETGDLDVTESLRIEGAGAAATVIDGGGLDGVIQGVAETATLDISGVTIRGGGSPDGEASPAVSSRGPRLTLTDTVVRDNVSQTAVGGNASGDDGGDLTITRTLIAGNTAGGQVVEHGPNAGGTLVIEDSQITGNASDGEIVDADPAGGTTTVARIAGTLIAGNTADDYGVDVNPSGNPTSATLEIDHSELRDNHLADSDGLVDFDPSSRVGLKAVLRITDSVFAGNRADQGIGGVLVDPCGGAEGPNDVDARIERTRFENNVAGGLGSPGRSGALLLNPCNPNGGDQSVSILDSTFVGNEARGSGGRGGAVSLFADGGRATIANSTFARNVAGTEGTSALGGALAIGSLAATVINSTFDGNTVGGESPRGGGAIGVDRGSLELIHSTLSDNAVSTIAAGGRRRARAVDAENARGGALWAGDATLRVTGSLLSGNTQDREPQDCALVEVGLTSGGSNLEGETSCGFTAAGDQQNVADAKLAPLGDNGGFTPTRALAADSPATDAAAAATCPATDQRGVARPVGPACDIGAFEYTAPPPPPPPPDTSQGLGPSTPVAPIGPPPVIVEPPPPAPLLLSCARSQIALVDVVRSGRRVRITGQAARSLAGKRVRLFVSDKLRRRIKAKRVGSAKVRADGTFAAKVARPPRRLRSPQYFAKAATGAPSSPLELDRRMYADSLKLKAGRITLKGHVTKPFPSGRGKVTILVQTDCHTRRVAATARLDRRGRFTVKFAAPTGVPEILVRARTNVPTRRGGAATNQTFTLPRPLKLG
ncbi:MAG TPA: CSLREA domain-containing protein [Solirubrobacteraceae bacterium]